MESERHPLVEQIEQSIRQTELNSVFRRVWSEVWEGLKRRLNEQDDLETEENIGEIIDTSAELSKAAGAYLRKRFQMARRKPRHEYAHEGRSGLHDTEQERLQVIQQLRPVVPRKHYLQARRILEQNRIHSGEVQETQDGDMRIQTRRETLGLQGSIYEIDEQVTNVLVNGVNVPQASLSIRDRATGRSLDLDQLLPDKFEYSPGFLVSYEDSYDPEQRKMKSRIIQKDLNDYPGMAGQDDFRASTGINRVAYGDLTVKGGPLSLLHEVAHAWQSVYLHAAGTSDRRSFEELYSKIGAALSVYDDRRRKNEQGEQGDYDPEWEWSYLQKSLGEFGVEVDRDRLDAASVSKGDGEMLLTLPFSKCQFVIKSKELDQMAAEFAAEERDAWAQAIRVLRFLRKRGFDLEPQVKNFADVKSIIEPCLGSYQQTLDSMIRSTVTGDRFSRLSQKRPIASAES